MKTFVKRAVGMVLVCALTLTCLPMPAQKAQAAKPYTLEKISHDQTINGKKCTIKVECYFRYVQLKGTTEAIEKINKSLKPKNYENYKSDAVETAKEAADEREGDDTYLDYTVQSLTYYGADKPKKFVSVGQTSVWYAGGVSNVLEGGSVYSLKTGKQIKKITTVTKQKSLTKIKKTLKKLIKKRDEFLDPSEVDEMKVSDFDFYITKNGKVCVCFGPYSLGVGGWTKKFYLAGDNL